MTSINSTTIRDYLSTLTVAQLSREHARVRATYQGAQIATLPEASYTDWMRHLDLIEEELASRITAAE